MSCVIWEHISQKHIFFGASIDKAIFDKNISIWREI